MRHPPLNREIPVIVFASGTLVRHSVNDHFDIDPLKVGELRRLIAVAGTRLIPPFLARRLLAVPKLVLPSDRATYD